MSPQNPSLEALPPSTSECDCIWRQVKTSKEVIKLKWGHKSGPAFNLTGILIRNEDKGHKTGVYRGKTMWGGSKKAAI